MGSWQYTIFEFSRLDRIQPNRQNTKLAYYGTPYVSESDTSINGNDVSVYIYIYIYIDSIIMNYEYAQMAFQQREGTEALPFLNLK